MTDKEWLTKLTNRELMTALVSTAKDVEFWKRHGYYGDGKHETAITELKLIKRLVLERMERGNV
jgi:hypothetical protein